MIGAVNPTTPLAFVLALLATGSALPQAYRWVDEKGRVQYGDAPPPGAKEVRKRELRLPEPQPAPLPFELARLQKDFPVTLYTSPGCREPCELARTALNRRGIPFQEVQVWNPETNEALKRVSGATEVPTLVVGRSVQRGFEQGAFDLLLDSAGYPREGVLPARAQKAPPPPEGYVPASDRQAPRPSAKPAISEPAPSPTLGRYATPQFPGEAHRPGRYAVPAAGDPSGRSATPEAVR
jgi:glutaredoxin